MKRGNEKSMNSARRPVLVVRCVIESGQCGFAQGHHGRCDDIPLTLVWTTMYNYSRVQSIGQQPHDRTICSLLILVARSMSLTCLELFYWRFNKLTHASISWIDPCEQLSTRRWLWWFDKMHTTASHLLSCSFACCYDHKMHCCYSAIAAILEPPATSY